jgi:hypothetical protein
MFRVTSSVVIACVLVAAGCGQAADPESGNAARAPVATPAASEAPQSEAWNAFVGTFVQDWLKAHPMNAFAAGRTEFAGRFPDWTRIGIIAEIRRLEHWRDRADGWDPSMLSASQRFERDYLLAVLDRNLFWMRDANWPFRNLEFYFDWGSDFLNPSLYLTKPYAGLETRMRDMTEFARTLPIALDQIRGNLQTPMPETWVELGVSTFGGMSRYFIDDVPRAFADVEDPALQAAFTEAVGQAAMSLAELASWFEGLRDTATDDYALGPELFSRMLRMTEGVDMPLADLMAVGRADLERNLALLDAACATFAPGSDHAACFAAMDANKPQGGAVAGARAQLGAIKAFMLRENLASIPADDPIFVEEAPPYQRSNFAFIYTAGPYERGMPSTYYIAPPDPAWPEQEQLDYIPGAADLMSTSVHEVWPGHFLQFLHSNRAASPVGQLFVGYAFAEGWAHYTEEMMADAGLAGGLAGGAAELRVGQIKAALLRNVRYLCAIGLHTGGMTVAECERLFREQAYQDPGNARQQAARGTYDPGYLNYTLGKLMIRKLRDDWAAGRGGRKAWGDFHDTFLGHGGPPIPMLRQLMLGPDAGPVL